MNVNHDTVKFIGILNRLSRMYTEYGAIPLSELSDERQIATHIVYDDIHGKEDGNWYICPLVNGMDGRTYNEMFPDLKFKAVWTDDEESGEGSSSRNPAIWVTEKDPKDGRDILYVIEKGGWYA